MKHPLKVFSAIIIALISLCSIARAGDKDMSHDCVMMKDGKMMVCKNGETTAMQSDVTLKNGAKVMTDGTVMTSDGQKMMMKNGESMSMDGTMMKAGDMSGGDMMRDSIMMKDGQMMVMKDGKSMMMKKDSMKLKDGTKVMKDGTVMMKDGTKMTLKEGDTIDMDGKMTKSGM